MTTEEIIYRLAAEAVSKMVNDGVSVQTISHHSRLSSSTIRKFMNQSTTFPRFHTVMAVLEYLGYEVNVTINKKGKANVLRPANVTHKSATSPLL